jgi:hypothetical protein
MKIPEHLRFTGAIAPVISLDSLQPKEDVVAIRADFDKSRLGYFTASEFVDLLTKGKKVAKNDTSRKYVERKAIERITGMSIQEDISSVKAIQRGIELEPKLIAAYEQRFGKLEFTGAKQKRCVDEKHNTSALPDGLRIDRPIEGKCPDLKNHVDNLDYAHDLEWFIEKRYDYWVQGQVQIWCASVEMKIDYKHFDFASYCEHESLKDENRLHVVTIPRDDEFINLCKKCALENIEILNAEINRRKKYFKNGN